MEYPLQLIPPWMVTWLAEPVAVLFGLLGIWYLKKEKLIGFPLGIVNVLTYILIFLITGLYANAAINFYFFLMQGYGWYNWSAKRGQESSVNISYTGWKGWVTAFTAITLSFVMIRYLLIRYTESEVPDWDALTTAIYVVAQWMISRKKIENWILWIVADVIMVVLCVTQGLYITSFQYAVFTVIAVLGYREWRSKLINATENSNNRSRVNR